MSEENEQIARVYVEGSDAEMSRPTSVATAVPEQGCIFCGIAAGLAGVSLVHEDATVVVFMALHPIVPGHLLVVPRRHVVGLEDIDAATSAHVWSVGHEMARALRRSSIRSDGINMFLSDGAAAFQTVFHFHLHVIPRYAGDGWTILPPEVARERSLLDDEAQVIRAAIASTD